LLQVIFPGLDHPLALFPEHGPGKKNPYDISKGNGIMLYEAAFRNALLKNPGQAPEAFSA
jgi:hypothetical protein